MKKIIKKISYISFVVLLSITITSCGTLNTTIENENKTTGETNTKTIKIGYDDNNSEVVNSEDVKLIKYDIDGDYVGNYVEIVELEDTLIKDKVLYKEYMIPIIIKNISDKDFEGLDIDIKYFDTNEVLIATGKGSLKDTSFKASEKARILITIDNKDMKNRVSSFEISRLVFYEKFSE